MPRRGPFMPRRKAFSIKTACLARVRSQLTVTGDPARLLQGVSRIVASIPSPYYSFFHSRQTRCQIFIGSSVGSTVDLA